jgi:hypothetical protein
MKLSGRGTGDYATRECVDRLPYGRWRQSQHSSYPSGLLVCTQMPPNLTDAVNLPHE